MEIPRQNLVGDNFEYFKALVVTEPRPKDINSSKTYTFGSNSSLSILKDGDSFLFESLVAVPPDPDPRVDVIFAIDESGTVHGQAVGNLSVIPIWIGGTRGVARFRTDHKTYIVYVAETIAELKKLKDDYVFVKR